MKARLTLKLTEAEVLKESAKQAGVKIEEAQQIRDDVQVEISFKSPQDVYKLGQYSVYNMEEKKPKTNK